MRSVNHLTVAYGDRTVIKDLSFSFPNGKVIGLIGPSGIGKTTLLNVLAGLIKPTGGTVEKPAEKISYIFQEPRLFPWMTALANVEAVTEDKARARALLASLLPDAEAKYPEELSGGMKQRVSIARALVYDGDVYFLDEPFKGLDKETKDAVANFFFQSTRGKTVLMVTHDEDDLEYCDVILRMEGDPVSCLILEDTKK